MLMKFALKIVFVISFCFIASLSSAQVRGVTIILCGDRTEDADIALAKQDLSKMMETDSFYCYPGAAAVTLPDECNSGTVVLSIELDPGDFFVGDALTVTSLSNINFVDGSEEIPDSIDFITDFRPAFVTDEDGRIEIEFTRDPTLPTVIELRNVNNGDGQTITIPACTGTVFNGDASPIPTMGQWGLMVLGLILLIFGVNSVVRSRGVQAT